MVLRPRWAKVAHDLWDNKGRTLLVVVAIAIGVSAFGGMFIAREVLLENMNNAYMATNPATIILAMDPFDENLLYTARTLPHVVDVNAYAGGSAQTWDGSSWLMTNVEAAPDLADISVNRITLEAGTLETNRDEILLERGSLALFDGLEVGDTLRVELPDNTKRDLRVVGVVHDIKSMSGARVRMVEMYTSFDTMQELGFSDQYDTLRIVTDPSLQTYPALEAAAETIIDRLERQGHEVNGYGIMLPGEHWATKLINAVVLILMLLGLVALCLSGFLVVNTITGLIAQQKRQIGMLKTVGARAGTIMQIYLALAGAFGVMALVLSLPLGVLLSAGMIWVLANFLNIDLVSFAVPAWVFLAQAGLAVAVPLLAALIPVIGAMRITVNDALSDYGLSAKGKQPRTWVDRLIQSPTLSGNVPRPVMLSLRNTFRRRLRLALTLAALTASGMLLTGVINARSTALSMFDSFVRMFGFDVEIALDAPQHLSRLEREAMRVPGVEKVEGWGFASGTLIRPEEALADGTLGSEEGPRVTLFGPPYDSAFIDPDMVEGRWLAPGDQDVVVVGYLLLDNEPYIKVGSEIEIDFEDQTRQLEVVGIVQSSSSTYMYAPFDYVTRLGDAPRQSSVALIQTNSRRVKDQERIARAVEEHFQQVGIGVSQAVTTDALIGMVTRIMDFFIYFLLLMAVLLGAVGGLGLASTMSLNVLERTRESGVMRAIGASNRALRGVFLTEGVLIALMSYVISSVLSIPISFIGAHYVGIALIDQPLVATIEPVGYAIWLVCALLIAVAASLLPANRAAAVSVRRSLAYE
ncbi:MAG: ABC transporter permease [Chloroflexota bacterium]